MISFSEESIQLEVSKKLQSPFEMASSFETLIEKACEDREIPGVTLLASDATGTFNYSKSFGPKTPTESMDLDSTFILASCTKLITSIAAMQCVENGLVTLDEDVSRVLYEWKSPKIITGFDKENGEPILESTKSFITLRHLLTHSGGMPYEGMSPLLLQYQKLHSRPSSKYPPLSEVLDLPLSFEPGASWQYGYGLDWTGILISRLTNLSLGEYFRKHIFNPLGITNITMHQEQNEEVRKNLVKLSIRKGLKDPLNAFFSSRNGQGVDWTDELIYENPTVNEFGGSGLIGSPVSFLKIMRDLISPSPKLLKEETIVEMFKPQLSGPAQQAYQGFCSMDFIQDTFGSAPSGAIMNYGLGGGMNMDDWEGTRGKGTLFWSGLANLLWTVDRGKGLVCFYASNLCPFGDFVSGDWQRKFESEMYTRLDKSKEKQKERV